MHLMRGGGSPRKCHRENGARKRHELRRRQADIRVCDAQLDDPGGDEVLRYAQHRGGEAGCRDLEAHGGAGSLVVAAGALHRLEQHAAAPPRPASDRHLPHPNYHHSCRDALPHCSGRRARVLAGIDPVGGACVLVDRDAVEVLADGSDVVVAGPCDVLQPVASSRRRGRVHREHLRRLPVRIGIAHQGIAHD
eukprot:3937224-Rhodomonas_salina.2